MKKRLFLAAVALVFGMGSMCLADGEKGHGDLAAPSEWAVEEIGYAENIGMLEGFKVPWTDAITREQFCELSYNVIDFALHPEWESNSDFSDTENEKVAGLYNLKVINGRGNGIFDPDGKITREEAATILFNMSEIMGMDTNSIISTLEAYADDGEISDWARTNVYNMRKIDVMSGSDTGFMPKDNITVEQAICTLYRLYTVAEKKADDTESFSGKLYDAINEEKNYVISPFSVKLALMMAADGAKGETQAEILRVLGACDIDECNEQIKSIIQNCNSLDILKLNVSNSIWINSDKTNQEFSESYKKPVEDVFGATAGKVTNENAKETINGWVSEKTNGKIDGIIREENADFWAMLINTVYFNGRWQKEFSKEGTTPDIFTDKNGKDTEMEFMNKTAWISYGSENGVEVVELPYLMRKDIFDENGEYVETKRIDGVDVSMYFVMSDNDVNPDKAVDTIETNTEFVSLSLPKFKVEYNKNLNDVLNGMGIEKAFSEDAEFSPMFNDGSMWISDVVHKTYLAIDEEGTEAAAVTAVGMAGSALPPEPKVVKFNKPFHFVVRDNASGETLFVGRYFFGEE